MEFKKVTIYTSNYNVLYKCIKYGKTVYNLFNYFGEKSHKLIHTINFVVATV